MRITNDNFDYKNDAIDKFLSGKVITRLDVMGSAVRYEGIYNMQNNLNFNNLYFISVGT